MENEIIERALASFDIETEAIAATKARIDRESLAEAIRLLSGAERIGTSGCGHSGIACMHFAHSLCCVERPARFISPAEAVHGAMGFIQAGDVMVLASRGGKTDELMKILEICRKKRASVISVTENLASPMAERADVVLAMAVPRECDRYNCQGTSSFTALSVIFDALQTGVMEACGYRSEQFALIHPGGAVGKRLNR